MPLALILSSYVAASRVGGGGQQYALAAFGIDPVLVPTVVFGRHPGKGSPGGAALEPEVFSGLVEAVAQDGLPPLVDTVVTGYFASPGQVAAAAAAVARVRAVNGRALVVVDPILGDEVEGLYVPEAVAACVACDLVPLADWVTPNLWELKRLTGEAAEDLAGIARAARLLGPRVLVTSVPAGEDGIGLLRVDGAHARLYAHPRHPRVPKGTGDVVAAVFAARLVQGAEPFDAACDAARAAAETVDAAVAWGSAELPLVALGPRLVHPTARVRVQDVA